MLPVPRVGYVVLLLKATLHRSMCMSALALVLVAPASHAQTPPAEKRIALVIGNADYPKLRLGNPENDARLIASNLRELGFDVNEQINIGVLQFRRVLRDFARKVQQDDAIAVLYYAGHGMQIDGRNYLLPIDINLRDQEEVKDESVDVDDLFLSRIDKVGSHPRIVILDACRDNPFGKRKTRNVSSSTGLAEMGARGTLIAFASAPGARAEDGPEGSNSVYTRNLAQEMMVPGIEVEQMFKNVRVKVLRETAGRQLPWVNTSLTSDFSLSPGSERASSAQRASAAPVTPSSPSATGPIAPKVALAAPSSTTASVAPSTTQVHKFLDKDELQQLLVGKSHTLRDAAAGYEMRLDLRSGGTVYFSSQSIGQLGSNGSGRWELKNDGSLCARFNALTPPLPANARGPDDGCWYYFFQGGKLARVSTSSPQAQPQFEVVNIK